jgi:hypothetical protein
MLLFIAYKSLKVAVQGPDFMDHPLYIHIYIYSLTNFTNLLQNLSNNTSTVALKATALFNGLCVMSYK